MAKQKKSLASASQNASTAQALSYHERVKGESRQAVVQAAVEVFLEHGYERTSLQQIAKQAGVSTATLFKRFPTKAALFEAIIPEFWRFDLERQEPLRVGDPQAGLRRIGREFAALARNPKMLAFYRVFIAESQRFPEMGKLVLERGKLPYLDRAGEYLKAEIDTGNLRAFDSARAAGQFMAMISDQLFWPVLLAPGFSVSTRDEKQAVEEAVLTIMARYGSAQKSSDTKRK